jgi:hypothetical protein
MTYTEFKALVQAYLHQEGNPKISEQVDGFIELGEAAINRRVRTQQMLQTVALSDLETGDPPLYPVPTDFLELYGIWQDNEPLEFVAVDQLRKIGHATQPATCHGYYSVNGGYLVFSEAPDTSSTLTYYARPTALRDVVGTITLPLFQRHQDLYLYSAMTEAAPLLRDEQRGVYWGQQRERVLEEIRLENWSAKLPKAQSLRVRNHGS